MKKTNKNILKSKNYKFSKHLKLIISAAFAFFSLGILLYSLLYSKGYLNVKAKGGGWDFIPGSREDEQDSEYRDCMSLYKNYNTCKDLSPYYRSSIRISPVTPKIIPKTETDKAPNQLPQYKYSSKKYIPQ